MSNRLKNAGKTPAKRKIAKRLKTKSLVQSNPKLAALILIITYFLLDYVMMYDKTSPDYGFVVLFSTLAMSTLYSFYANDYHRGLFPRGGKDIPKFVKNKKKYALIGWLVICLWGVVLLVAEPFIVPKFFSVIDHKYHQSQIILMLYIAPIMEEMTFRYLLYDRWLKRKWGWFLGFVITSLIFVLCHPIGNVHSFIIYWIPTVLFYLVYSEFGLYGSIIIHMVYNLMAI